MQIINKKILTDVPEGKITQLEVFAPQIAQKAKPGQFVVLMAVAEGERIPLTIVNCNQDKGTITLILQEVGLTTRLLGKMNAGDSLASLAGPLGSATEVKNYGRVILVGGGVGIAEIYPVAKAFKEAGNQITAILGAKTKALLILEEELKGVCDELYISTDDGSYGKKGFTTDILLELLKVLSNELRAKSYNLVYAVGPIPMMRQVACLTKNFNLKTMVSLNPIMVDGTGMCGCCRVEVGGETKFSCVDGPEFDAHLVDWQTLINRNRVYQEKEQHICDLLWQNKR